MQNLLYVFSFICIAASALYFWRHKRARRMWFAGVLAAALIAVCTPLLMDRMGNATGTIIIVAGAGLAAFTAAMLAARFLPERNEADERLSAPAPGTNIRYLYGSVRASEPPEAADVSPAQPEDSPTDLHHIGDGKLSLAKRFSLWRKNRRIKIEEDRPSLQDEVAARTGRPFSPEEQAFLHLYDEEEDQEEHITFSYRDPDTEDRRQFDEPGGIETIYVPDSPKITVKSIQSPAADERYTEDGPLWGEEIAVSRDGRKFAAPAADEAEKPAADAPVPPLPSPIEPIPDIPEPVIPEPVIPEQPVAAPREKAEPVTTRMGNELLMDQAFALMNEGKWSEAADMFLRFRDSAQAKWLRKQADIERLNALLHAKRYAEAVDLLFHILDDGYDLSTQERAQIMNVLRRLQGG